MSQHSNHLLQAAGTLALSNHANSWVNLRTVNSGDGGDDDPPPEPDTGNQPKQPGSKPFPDPPPGPDAPPEEEPSSQSGNVYALLIGINHYEYFVEQAGDLNLHGCIRDSQLVEQYLKKKWNSRNVGSFSAN